MLELAQIRAARALLGLATGGFGQRPGVGTATIQRIEKSEQPATGYVSTLMRIQAAFEKAGILFINADEMGGFGLRLAKKKKEIKCPLGEWRRPVFACANGHENDSQRSNLRTAKGSPANTRHASVVTRSLLGACLLKRPGYLVRPAAIRS